MANKLRKALLFFVIYDRKPGEPVINKPCFVLYYIVGEGTISVETEYGFATQWESGFEVGDFALDAESLIDKGREYVKKRYPEYDGRLEVIKYETDVGDYLKKHQSLMSQNS